MWMKSGFSGRQNSLAGDIEGYENEMDTGTLSVYALNLYGCNE
jgi:hypothetical protein